MIQFSRFEKSKKEESLISDFFYSMVNRRWNKGSGVKTFIKDWVKTEKQKEKKYYEIIRNLLQVYEQQRKEKKYLPSCDEIYEKYIQEKETKAKERILKRKNMKVSKNTKHTIIENSVEIE